MTEKEERNLATAKRYVEYYNNDVERLVSDCYTTDCVVHTMGAGAIHGPKQFLEVEQAVLRAAPKRRMRAEHMHVTGDVVVVEITLLDADQGTDWELPFSAVLNMRDGKIAVDRSYAEWAKWPGLSGLS